MKKKKNCGCKEASKLRKKVLNTNECFETEFDASDIISQHNFQKNKQFKVLFKEQLDVVWNKKTP